MEQNSSREVSIFCASQEISLPPRRGITYFGVVVGLVRSHGTEIYAGGSLCYW